MASGLRGAAVQGLLLGAGLVVLSIVVMFGAPFPFPAWIPRVAGLALVAVSLLLLRRTMGPRSDRDAWQQALPFVPMRWGDAWKPFLLPAVFALVYGVAFLVQQAGVEFSGAWVVLACFFALGFVLTTVGGWRYFQGAAEAARDTTTPAFARPKLWAVGLAGGLLGSLMVLPMLWSGLTAEPPAPGWTGTVEEVWVVLQNETVDVAIPAGGPTYLLDDNVQAQHVIGPTPAKTTRIVIALDDEQTSVRGLEVKVDGRWVALEVTGGGGPWQADDERLGGAQVRITLERFPQLEGTSVQAVVSFQEHLWCKHVRYSDGKQVDECERKPMALP